jgi:hypothetical protein
VKEVKLEIHTVDIPDHLKGRDYSSDAEHRRNVKNWLGDIWTAKDERLSAMLRQ